MVQRGHAAQDAAADAPPAAQQADGRAAFPRRKPDVPELTISTASATADKEAKEEQVTVFARYTAVYTSQEARRPCSALYARILNPLVFHAQRELVLQT